MKRFLWLIAMAVGINLTALAQEPYPGPSPTGTITRAEYFFDADPGFGNGTSIAITPGSDLVDVTATLTINGSGLSRGIHFLYLRTMDSDGRWSMTNMRLFENFGTPVYSSVSAPAALITAEYFFDTDPGTGNGNPIALAGTSDESNISVAISLSGLTPGVHRLYLRTKDASGKWSITNYALFDNAAFIPYPTAAPLPAIAQAEYYIDTDPGFGNGVPVTVPASNDVSNFSVAVSLTGITQGRHTIYLRSKQNPWSMSAYAEFLVGSTLPVQWLFVKGEVLNDDTRISWATGAEDNTSHFEIEYSKDGVAFSKAGQVAATGNATGSSYSFRHLLPGNGPIWYRIKQWDKDGKFSFSKTILLFIDPVKDKVVLFPNPATNEINLSIPTTAKPVRVVIRDAMARAVYQQQFYPGQQATTVPVKNWAKGMYYLTVERDDKTEVMKFLKQ